MKPAIVRSLIFSVVFSMLSLTGWSQNIRIEGIELTGNQITKKFIIVRELPFSVGDTIPEAEFNEQLRLRTKT